MEPCAVPLALTWEDRRSSGTSGTDLYWAQVISAGGVGPFDAPVTRALGDQAAPGMAAIATSLFYGALRPVVAWVDFRSGQDIYAQTLPPAWPESGLAVCTAPGAQLEVALAGELDHVIIAWVDDRSGEPAIYAQRLDGDGNALWAADGIPVCSEPGSKAGLQAAPVGLSGAYLAWVDSCSGQPRAYALRIEADGSPASGWTAGGVPVAPSGGRQKLSRLLSSTTDGIYLTFTDDRSDPQGDAFDQRLLPEGTRAPGWPAEGATINDGPGAQVLMDAGVGNGLVVCWTLDAASPSAMAADRDLYATRLLPGGTRAPGWSADGNPVCVRTGDAGAARVAILDDGAYFTWQDARSATPRLDIYAQRLLLDGQRDPRWPGDGVVICDAPGDQAAPVIGRTEGGSAIIAWQDDRDFATSMTDLYAQIVNAAGEVDVAASGPTSFRVGGPNPNPSRGPVELVVESPAGGEVHAAIFDLAGREVWRALVGKSAGPGWHVLRWEGRTRDGRALPPGLYYLRLRAGDRGETRRLVRLQ